MSQGVGDTKTYKTVTIPEPKRIFQASLSFFLPNRAFKRGEEAQTGRDVWKIRQHRQAETCGK
jgi:hypothetical protein